MEIETPVLFIVFNRPDCTARVFDEIRKARPKRLFLVADAPRKDRAGETERCSAVRGIVEQVDWECDFQTNFREENVGCQKAVSSGIDWFFEHVDEGIILEDDCLPNRSFFAFCQTMLERYRHDERIMQISGSNYLFGKKKFSSSYYFSKLNDVWGWATWKRAWSHFDLNMAGFLEFKREKRIYDYFDDQRMAKWMMGYFDEAYGKGGDIWSAQWSYAMCLRNALTVVPGVNLVSNIGFENGDGTHGQSGRWRLYSGAKTHGIEEIIHPLFCMPDGKADELRFEMIARTDPRMFLENRMKNVAKDILSRIMSNQFYDKLIKIKNG